MSAQLRPGDRIHVTVRNTMHGYLPGDKGTVVDEVIDLRGARYYLVAMDKADPSKPGVIFSDDEIEPDT
jgi:hypothetical protein